MGELGFIFIFLPFRWLLSVLIDLLCEYEVLSREMPIGDKCKSCEILPAKCSELSEIVNTSLVKYSVVVK